MKIEPLQYGEITLSFTDIGKPIPNSEFLTLQIRLLTQKNKMIAKISKLTVYADITVETMHNLKINYGIKKILFLSNNYNYQ